MLIKASTKYFPRLTQLHIRRVLQWLNPLDLAGIEVIRLMEEQASEKPLLKKQPFYLEGGACLGEYKKREKRTGYINLYARHLYIGVPAFFKLTPVATLRIAFTLAHEIGHHIIARRGYIYEPTEKFKLKEFNDEYREGLVNRYAGDVVRRMSKRWYYRLGHWLNRRLSESYYAHGTVVWEKQEYKRAAYYWFCAYYTDFENDEAARAWQQAIARLKLAEAKSNNSFNRSAG